MIQFPPFFSASRSYNRKKSFRMIDAASVIFLLFLSFRVNAYVSCPSAKVMYIQPQNDIDFILLEGQEWQKLGSYEEPSLPSKLSVALTAHSTGKKVILRFPDGHDANCAVFNASVSSMMIRLLDN